MKREKLLEQVQLGLHSCTMSELKKIWLQLIDEFCANTINFAHLWKKSAPPQFDQLKHNAYYYEIPDIYATMPTITQAMQQMKWQELRYLQHTSPEELVQLILSMLNFRLDNKSEEKRQRRLLTSYNQKLYDQTVNDVLCLATKPLKKLI